MLDAFTRLSDHLYYSKETLTVYYFWSDGTNHLFAPYIRNGHFCEYRDGKIVEVIPMVKVVEDY